jgi:transposase
MSIVADVYRVVVGIDTHARTHHLVAVEAATGKVIGSGQFAATAAGIGRAVAWVNRHAAGGPVLAAVEGTASYGAPLARALQEANIKVAEARPPKRAQALRRGRGKSDQIDAEAAARTVLGQDTGRLITPRQTAGAYQAMTVLLAARERDNRTRTANINALTALLRTCDLGIDARRALSKEQIKQISKWDTSGPADPDQILRAQAQTLAKDICDLDERLWDNLAQLRALVLDLAGFLLALKGVGPVSAARILVSRSGPGRISSQAAFARLAGTAPIPASSGNTTRHRLSRGGDRRLNQAIDTIARTRMGHCDDTRGYVEKCLARGKTKREARRLLKRYITRKLHRLLTKAGL